MRKFLICIFLSLILLFISGCGTINIKNNEKESPDEVIETTDSVDYKNIVTDAYSDTVNGRKISIPKINLDSSEIDEINNEIWEELYIDGVENKKEIPSGSSDDYISYRWYLNDDIVSIIIEDGTENDMWMNYIVYNVSIDDKREIDSEDVIIKAGFTKDEYTKRAKQAIESRFLNLYGNNYAKEDLLQDEYFNEALNDSLSNDNIEDAYTYINENGQMCIIVPVYSPSFGDLSFYYADLNLEDVMLESETNETIGGTNEESIEIDKNLLIKDWEAEVPYDEYTFYYRLSFVSDTEVEYIAGYAFSEITYFAKGTYTIDGDLLTLELTDENGTDTSVYMIEVDQDNMTMDYVSGKAINVVQGENTSLTYHTRVYY